MYLCTFKIIRNMKTTISVYCKNIDQQVEVPCGITQQEFVETVGLKQDPDAPFLGALVNNKVRDMSFRFTKPSTVEFFNYYSTYGRNGYMRSLFFLLFHAVDKLLPHEVKLHIKHSISGGRYCTLENLDGPISEELVKKLYLFMKATVLRNLPFVREEMLTADAIAAFQAHGLEDKYEFFKNRDRIFTSVYHLDDSINYYYGFLVPSTGYLTTFGLEKYEEGLLLKLPSKKNIKAMAKTRSFPKLFSVYKMDKDWVASMGVPYVFDLNKYSDGQQIQGGVLVAEAYQEKHLARVADMIHQNSNVKMVLISGPSSSGKTTSCRRLSVQLAVLGYHPVPISVDDFFVERDETPRDEHGEKKYPYMPYIVGIIDEFSDMIMTAGKEVETPLVRIAQKARAVGIHMIIATQRPSSKVITGLIKGNFPGRIAFAVAQGIDSQIIIDRRGAQQLIGRGDMLFQIDGEVTRLQCPFVDTPDIVRICDYIKEQEDNDRDINHEVPYMLPEYVGNDEGGGSDANVGNVKDRDPLFEEAVRFVVMSNTASTSSLQRRYEIGYNRAGRLMDQMEHAGIVGPAQGSKPRQVLVSPI